MGKSYARLAGHYFLRGWDDVPMAVCRWGSREIHPVDKKTAYVLTACNGETDFESFAFLPVHRAILGNLVEDGIAEYCAPGSLPAPHQVFHKAENPLLTGLDWSITGRCNLKCLHCFMESPSGKYGQLSFAEVAKLIEQMHDANVLQVALTGGEPFMRKDITPIMEMLAEKHIWLSQVYSNGLLMEKHHLRKLDELGLSPAFQISFDGLGSHDRMRGMTGIEDKVIDSIRLIRESGFRIVVSTSIDQLNAAALVQTYELMKDLGVISWRVSIPESLGNWRHSTTAISVDQCYDACVPVLKRWHRDDKPFHIQLGGFYKGAPFLDAVAGEEIRYTPEDYDCRTLRDQAYLLPDATLVPCPGYVDIGLEKDMPNLLGKRSLSQVWRRSTLRDYADIKISDVLKHNQVCAECDHLESCGTGCRASALNQSGHFFNPDPLACELSRGRYRERMLREIQ